MSDGQIHPRILVIDDEERVREDLCAIFEPLGYEVQVAMGSGPILLSDAKDLAGKFRPHVAIVDMRLLLNEDPNDRSGMELIETLDPTHCILYSAYITHEISRKLAEFKTAGWIGKEEPPSQLVDLVKKVVRESSAEQKGFRIDKNSVDFDKESRALLGGDEEIPPRLIQDVLSQVFPGDSGIKVETIPGAVKTPMSVNRGRSLILKVKRGGMSEPFVVKLSKDENISREYKNYKENIEGNLKGGFYAHLIGEPRTFWDMGAVVYTFIGSSDPNITFSAYYQQEDDSAKILLPLQTFFGEVWYGLYSGETGEIKTSLYSSYDRFLKLEERLASFPDQSENRAYGGINPVLPNPVTWVRKHKEDSSTLSARWAVTHGDLHGDNLFVDGIHAWAIDFERSGKGHILRDFAELEVDILTRLAWEKDTKDLGEFFSLLVSLTDPHHFKEARYPIDGFMKKEFRKAFNVVLGIRSLAKDLTKFGDAREYIWSLLFDAVFVSAYNGEQSPQHDRSLLYASLLCTCLQNWGHKWPPVEWQFQPIPVGNPGNTNKTSEGTAAMTSPIEQQAALTVLTEATKFLFSEVGKGLEFWRQKKGNTLSPKDIAPETRPSHRPIMRLDDVEQHVNLERLERLRSRIENSLDILRKLTRELDGHRNQKATDTLLDPKHRAYLDNRIPELEEQIKLESENLRGWLEEVYKER